MRMIGGMGGLSASEYEALRRRQDQLLRSDIEIRPAPSSRTKNSKALTDQQLERLPLLLLEWDRQM
jgi:hypothetical protein